MQFGQYYRQLEADHRGSRTNDTARIFSDALMRAEFVDIMKIKCSQ